MWARSSIMQFSSAVVRRLALALIVSSAGVPLIGAWAAANAGSGTVQLILIPCRTDIVETLNLHIIHWTGAPNHEIVSRVVTEITVRPRVAVVRETKILLPGLYSAAVTFVTNGGCQSPSQTFFSVGSGSSRTIVLGTTRRFFNLPPSPEGSVIVQLPFAGLTAHLLTPPGALALDPGTAYGIRDGPFTYFDSLRAGEYELWINTGQFAYCKTLRVRATYAPLLIVVTARDVQVGFAGNIANSHRKCN